MARARSTGRPTSERKIHFYRIAAGNDDSGRPLPFVPGPALAHVNSLPFTLSGRYLADGDRVLCAWVDRDDAEPQHVRFAGVRRSAFPQVEDHGAISPLAIAASAGLAEQVHIVFFGNNILGSEFNFYGPRTTRLAGYLHEKARDLCPPFTIEPLLKSDAAAQLQRIGELRVLDLKIRSSWASTAAQADQSLGSAFAAAAEAGGAEVVELVLRQEPYSRRSLPTRVLEAVRRLASRDDLQENVDRFVITGVDSETARVTEVDLLKDKLVSVKRILRQDRTRALISESAYAAIESAYGELRDEIERAAAIGVR